MDAVNWVDALPGLTAEQATVAMAPPGERMLVTAEAGTGKTHTLVARLVVLFRQHGLAPGQDVLVLSFSRAAIRVVRDRVAGVEGDASYVKAVTFDSFATRLLAQYDPGGSWVQEGYERRIVRATRLVSDNEEAGTYVLGLRHIVVDETQDLVGERVAFVRALLDTCPAGFTVFGDPAQAIYGFQSTGSANTPPSPSLYAWIRGRFSGSLVEHTLGVNFRAETEDARIALWAGPELNGPTPDFERIRFRLCTALMRCPSVGSVDMLALMLRRRPGDTAILCRDNGQALTVSRELHRKSVSHRLQRPASERTTPAWIAKGLAGFDDRLVVRTDLQRRFEQLRVGDDGRAPTGPQAWALLKRLDGRASDDLDVGRVREAVASSSLPDEMFDSPLDGVVVSTVHRAKGLEFDRVVLLQPREREGSDDDVGEEARIVYVGMTRPRRELIQMSRPETRGLYRLGDRWIRKDRNRLTDIQLLPDDVDLQDPSGPWVLGDTEVLGAQRYLWEEVGNGDPLTLRAVGLADAGVPRYAVEHRKRVVGITSEAFGHALRGGLGRGRGRREAPGFIVGLRVDDVETVAGSDALTRQWGLGVSGLWLRVRVAGLGELSAPEGVDA